MNDTDKQIGRSSSFVHFPVEAKPPSKSTTRVAPVQQDSNIAMASKHSPTGRSPIPNDKSRVQSKRNSVAQSAAESRTTIGNDMMKTLMPPATGSPSSDAVRRRHRRKSNNSDRDSFENQPLIPLFRSGSDVLRHNSRSKRQAAREAKLLGSEPPSPGSSVVDFKPQQPQTTSRSGLLSQQQQPQPTPTSSPAIVASDNNPQQQQQQTGGGIFRRFIDFGENVKETVYGSADDRDADDMSTAAADNDGDQGQAARIQQGRGRSYVHIQTPEHSSYSSRGGDIGYRRMNTRNNSGVDAPDGPIFIFNMSNLPYITEIRILLIILCTMSFFCSFFVSMPLAAIQKTTGKDQCFLKAHINVITKDSKYYKPGKVKLASGAPAPATITTPSTSTTTAKPDKNELPLAGSRWGKQTDCDFSTFTAVSVAIFSVIIGWATLQMWPDIMASGKGDVLTLLYTAVYLCCIISIFFAYGTIDAGRSETCKQFTDKSKQSPFTCKDVSSKFKVIGEELKDSGVWSLERTLNMVQTACVCLISLTIFQMALSAVALCIIWFYYYRDATAYSRFMYSTQNSDTRVLNTWHGGNLAIPQGPSWTDMRKPSQGYSIRRPSTMPGFIKSRSSVVRTT